MSDLLQYTIKKDGEYQKELIECIELKNKENERLKEEYIILQNASDKVEEELQQRIDKAIEFIKENENNISSIKDLENNKTYNSALLSVKDILQGVDKE